MIRQKTFLSISKYNNGIDRERSLSIRGICMLMIIFHHAFKNVELNRDILGIHSWGYIGTGVFFFFSGYGLFYSLSKRNEIPLSWLYEKMKAFILPFFVVLTSYYLLSVIIPPGIIDLKGFLQNIVSLTVPNSKTWFFKIIVFVYIYVFIVFRLFNNGTVRILVIFASSFVYFLLARYLLDGYWYNTILNFPLGMLFCYKKEQINRFCTNYALTTILVASLLLLCVINSETIETVFYTLIAVIISMYLEINIRFLKYIGKNSLICYLSQIVIIYYTRQLIENDLFYVLVAIILIYIYTLLYNFIFNKN